jgi:hypothetical protein
VAVEALAAALHLKTEEHPRPLNQRHLPMAGTVAQVANQEEVDQAKIQEVAAAIVNLTTHTTITIRLK